jgi:hypothetical protein
MIYVNKDNLGRNVYKIKTQYVLTLEQYVLADTYEDAENKVLDQGGLRHDYINRDITFENSNIETDYIEVEYSDSETEYLGKVVQNENDADEVLIDEYAKPY